MEINEHTETQNENFANSSLMLLFLFFILIISQNLALKPDLLFISLFILSLKQRERQSRSE